MPFERQDMTGSFWLTPKRKTSKTSGREYDSYSGQCKIDGKEYWMNALLKETSKGQVYDIRFKLKDVDVSNLKF